MREVVRVYSRLCSWACLPQFYWCSQVCGSMGPAVTRVLIANEAASSPAVNVTDVNHAHTTIRSGLTDLGSVGGAQNQMEETRREYEDSLKTYRELAKKETETYLPHCSGDAQRPGDSR